MTISYMNDVASAGGLVFLRLLMRWHGSVYKLLWKDLLAFLILYYLIHILYMFGLSDENQKVFEGLVTYCARYGNFIPLSFVLGFFVSTVMTRWWNQYMSIPWPTSVAVFVSSTIHGYDEVGRAMRRTIMRYLCLSLTMVLRVLSPRVQKRFPKMSNLVDAGLIQGNELVIIEDLENKFPGYSKNFLPIVWAAGIVTRARKEGRIRDDFAAKTIIEGLNKFRGECGVLMTYNTISIPLVYTQVVTIAVYTYFITALMAQQYVETSGTRWAILDVIPFLIIFQFIFYMGWLKVAETLMNPFGEDDDDFDVNSMIDRNLQMSYLIVDDMHNEHPELLKDQFWNGMPPALFDQHKVDFKESDLPQRTVDQRDTLDYKVVEGSSFILRRRTTTSFAIPSNRVSEKIVKQSPSDVEIGNALQNNRKTSFQSPRFSVSNINPNLVPRSSVISGKFKNDAQVLKDQTILEREMDEIRIKNEQLIESKPEEPEESNVESEEPPDVAKNHQ